MVDDVREASEHNLQMQATHGGYRRTKLRTGCAHRPEQPAPVVAEGAARRRILHNWRAVMDADASRRIMAGFVLRTSAPTCADHPDYRHPMREPVLARSLAAAMTLADFLLARIAEDERIARAAKAADDNPDTFSDVSSAADHSHYLRHTPDRVLAECEAKRRIVESFSGAPLFAQVLRLLALSHADHPDYDQGWRP
jgi:uncharacterized protein DUF6221